MTVWRPLGDFVGDEYVGRPGVCTFGGSLTETSVNLSSCDKVCYHICMQRVMFQLDDEDVSALDEFAAAEGVSRAELGRRAIKGLIASMTRALELEAVRRAYLQQPPEKLGMAPELVAKAWPGE